MSIECTTSANSTVTCLYSARTPDSSTGGHNRDKTGRSLAARCHTCGTRSLRSSDPPRVPAPEVPVHQHRALDPAQNGFSRSPSAARLARQVDVSLWAPIT
jgi:hypothetical protein